MIELTFAIIGAIAILGAVFIGVSDKISNLIHERHSREIDARFYGYWREFVDIHMYMNSNFPILDDILKRIISYGPVSPIEEFREEMEDKYLHQNDGTVKTIFGRF